MFPSSGRVKFNRVALKDVVGVKLVPRRREAVTAESGKQNEQPEDTLVRDAVCASSVSGDRGGAESVTERVTHLCGAEPEENLVGARRSERRHPLQASKELSSMELNLGGAVNPDVNRNTQPSLPGLTGSEGSLRRAVTASCCVVCGDCKFISCQRKTLGKQGQKNRCPSREQPTIELRINKADPVNDNSKKITVWVNQYPKVMLCDIAQKYNVSSDKGSYVLPDDLKTKVVYCFKDDSRKGFRFGPCCSGQNSHKWEECCLTENSKLCPRLHSDSHVCHCQSLDEHQRCSKECTGTKILSNHTMYNFRKGLTSESTATCSASFSLGKCKNKCEYRTSMEERDVEEDQKRDQIGVIIHRDKRIKLRNIVKDGSLSSTLDLKSISYNDAAKTLLIDKDRNPKPCSGMSGGGLSCPEMTVWGCITCRSVVKENTVKPFGQIDEPRIANGVQKSLELLYERNLPDLDESFTCQRVRVYHRKVQFSCARTNMSWPFSNRSPTLIAHSGTIDSPVEPIHPMARNSDSPLNQTQPHVPRSQTKHICQNTKATYQVSCQAEEKQGDDGEHIITKRNGKTESNMSSHSSDIKHGGFAPHLAEAVESQASLVPLTPSQHKCVDMQDLVSAQSTPNNRPESYSSMSTPSPSALGLSGWETAAALSLTSSLSSQHGLCNLSTTPPSNPPSSLLLEEVKGVEGVSSPMSFLPYPTIKAIEKPFLYSEETQMATGSSSPSTLFIPTNTSDSFNSSGSSLLLPQDEQSSDKYSLIERSPPILEPYYNISSFHQSYPVAAGKGNSSYITEDPSLDSNSNDIILPPLLSPVTSPQQHSSTSFLSHGQCSSDEEEKCKHTSKHRILPGLCMSQIGNGNQYYQESFNDHQSGGSGNEEFERVSSNLKSQSSDTSDGDNQGETEQVPFTSKTKKNLSTGAGFLAEPSSSPSSNEGQLYSTAEQQSSSSEIVGCEMDKAKIDAAGGSPSGKLDEFTAYEQDILLVDVIPDDPELFENLPDGSLLKLGPTRVRETSKTRPKVTFKTPQEVEQRLTPVVNFHCYSPDIAEEHNSRPWRPQCSSKLPKLQNTDKQTRSMGHASVDNSQENRSTSRNQPIQRVNFSGNNPALVDIRNGLGITFQTNTADFRRQKSNSYCRLYFSESLSCGFKMCRFQHVPVEGDEKFCVETVMRFVKNPMCIQKARAVFTSYYQNNPPGVYFSKPVFVSLLWALLKADMVSDVFSVLSVSLAHEIVPSCDFLLALFNLVREKGLVGYIPELMQLTSKMASAGLVLSSDCLDCVKNTPEFQESVSPNSSTSVSGNHKLSTSAPSPEYFNLAHSIVEIELCTKQEDWKRMGKVFRSIFQSSQDSNQVEQISGRIAIALLSESKDKLSLPFAAFAEIVCQCEAEDSLILSFLGRIGVSLMLRYHKTHQWAKGRRVVEVLSISKVDYSILKGLFGNEDGTSRCCLITMATELFLLSGSVEGALNTLRENKWFLSSSTWPCEPADLDGRGRVLMRLAEKTSHRDTLEVLCNLPGVKEPNGNDLVDISRYSPAFNSHLQMCVDRQILPVASDTVKFMLSKNLAVDQAVLQILLQKLAKQNLWLRAREVFKHSLSVGYYPAVSAPPGLMALAVPCQLWDVELALAFEMFITVNATVLVQLSETTTTCLSITLKRTQSGEREYLSAGSRLLSAAGLPQPKLMVHYTAVNASQEQVFTLDISSARHWLRHNHLWANEMWKH